MVDTSIAALESALAAGSVESWLKGLQARTIRPRVRRMLEADRRLLSKYPDSLGSCLLARTFGDRAFASLHEAWQRELAARGRPWIRPMRALPWAGAPLAELHAENGLSFKGLQRPSFASEDEVVVEALRLHPSVQPPEQRRHERLRWRWKRGAPVVEPVPRDEPAKDYPRFETKGWGPSFLLRAPEAPPVELPCPEEGSADAQFSADGSRVIVYGTHDEYAGGFVWVVDPETLAVERKLETDSPVSRVYEGGRGTLLVTTSRSGTLAWIGTRARQIPDLGEALCVSPSGDLVASLGASLQIWSLAELVHLGVTPPEPGFPPQFDPSGDRLLWEMQLLDGRTGRQIAALAAEFGRYLEGGPAQPSLYFGTRHLISTHGGLQIWDTRTGEALTPEDSPPLSMRYTLAYDRAGSWLAALCQGEKTVTVHELPHGRCVRTLEFTVAGAALAMSPDGGMIAAQDDGILEVRTALGELVLRCGQATTKRRDSFSYWHSRPCFSADGRRIARYVEDDGWRIWTLAGGDEEHAGKNLEDVADFASPRPRDWTIEVARMSVFTHVPTGVQIALPTRSSWICNPADPRIVVCGDLHAELCAG